MKKFGCKTQGRGIYVDSAFARRIETRILVDPGFFIQVDPCTKSKQDWHYQHVFPEHFKLFSCLWMLVNNKAILFVIKRIFQTCPLCGTCYTAPGNYLAVWSKIVFQWKYSLNYSFDNINIIWFFVSVSCSKIQQISHWLC